MEFIDRNGGRDGRPMEFMEIKGVGVADPWSS